MSESTPRSPSPTQEGSPRRAPMNENQNNTTTSTQDQDEKNNDLQEQNKQTEDVKEDRERSRSRSSSRDRRRRRSRSRSENREERRERRRRSISKESRNHGTTLYVHGLAPSVHREDLKKKFIACGEISEVSLVTDPRTRQNRGFGFITFVNAEDAEKAIQTLDGVVIEGSKITVEKARRSRPRTPTPGRYLGAKPIRSDSYGGQGGGGAYPPRSSYPPYEVPYYPPPRGYMRYNPYDYRGAPPPEQFYPQNYYPARSRRRSPPGGDRYAHGGDYPVREAYHNHHHGHHAGSSREGRRSGS